MTEPVSLVNPAAGGRFGSLAAALRHAWVRHGAALEWLAIAVMAAAAAGRLAKGFFRLLWDDRRTGAIDLKLFHRVTQQWFAGTPVYPGPSGSVFPPATYPLLWPLVGWLDIGAARWLWAVTTVLAVSWLAILVVRESCAVSARSRLFVVLLILSMSGTGLTIGNGQLILHLLPGLVAGLLLIIRRNDWRTDVAAAALLLFALVKPHVAAPFAWIALLAPGRLRPALLLGLGYAGLTMLAASFQDAGLISLFGGWLANVSRPVSVQGYANLNNWLHALHLDPWMLLASLASLAGLGLWVAAHRRAEPWLLLGVAALVSRLWAYHFVYDDVLTLLPMVALYRNARSGPARRDRDVAAALLLAATLTMALAPARLVNLSWPWGTLYEAGQTAVWLAMLAFLLLSARTEREPTLAESTL